MADGETDRGSKITLREIALAVALFVQVGGMIWIAATTKASLDNALSTVAKLERGYEYLREAVQTSALLAYRLAEAERKIDALEARRAR